MDRKCFVAAIALLARRDYSRAKLQKKLQSRGYPPETIETTLEHLIQCRYLREENYVQGRIRSFIRRNYSPLYAVQSLQRDGVQKDLDEVRQLYLEEGVSELDLAKKVIEKKKRMGNPTLLQLSQGLASKGFSFEIASRLLFNSDE